MNAVMIADQKWAEKCKDVARTVKADLLGIRSVVYRGKLNASINLGKANVRPNVEFPQMPQHSLKETLVASRVSDGWPLERLRIRKARRKQG